VNAEQLNLLIHATLPKQMPILVTGMPGIGKTAVVKQAIEDMEWDALFSHPVTDEPIDYKGLPWIQDGVAKFFPVGVIDEVLRCTQPTAWVIDDVGQAMLSVQASFMQWLHRDSRTLNGQALPDCVSLIMMTNRKEDRAGVSGFLEPFKSRFFTIVELEAHVQSFVNWGIQNNIDPMIMAYLQWKPGQLSDFDPTSGLEVTPNPRAWHHLSDLIKLGLPSEMEAEMFSGCVGEATAIEFIGFRGIYKELPPIADCYENPDSALVPSKTSIIFALIGSLAKRACPDNLDGVLTYMRRLAPEFQVVFTEMLTKYWDDVTDEKEFTRWSVHIQKHMV